MNKIFTIILGFFLFFVAHITISISFLLPFYGETSIGLFMFCSISMILFHLFVFFVIDKLDKRMKLIYGSIVILQLISYGGTLIASIANRFFEPVQDISTSPYTYYMNYFFGIFEYKPYGFFKLDSDFSNIYIRITVLYLPAICIIYGAFVIIKKRISNHIK